MQMLVPLHEVLIIRIDSMLVLPEDTLFGMQQRLVITLCEAAHHKYGAFLRRLATN